jgi:hypothetical protein
MRGQTIEAMDLKTTLLAERDTLLGEIALLEKILRSRCGWQPDLHSRAAVADNGVRPELVLMETAMAPPSPSASLAPAAQPRPASSLRIRYKEEATAWLARKRKGDVFNTTEFVRYLEQKYGCQDIPSSSAGTPFVHLAKAGGLQLLNKGVGRRANLFKVI